MSYVVIEDFKAGLDKRKLKASSPQGSLQTLSNAHITRGGEIEKRKAWVAKYALPAGTFGFDGANGVLSVFSSTEKAMPDGISCQVLPHPNGNGMSEILDTEFFDGMIYASAKYDNGDYLCFYNGVRVEDWDADSGFAVAGKKAVSILTVKNKVYAAAESVLNFSAVAEPTLWGSGTGSGFINMSNQSAGSELLTGVGRYQGNLAVFSRRNTQIWFVDPDPLQNAQRQVLSNIGTFAQRSIVSFGDIDVFFLSDTGVRSLRARNSSNQAGVNDVGTPIDDEVLRYMRTLTDEVKAQAAAALEPIDGRYILAIGNRAFVFSYYGASQISAWSSYDLDFQITSFVSMDGRVWARAGDTIYLYGGDDGQEYDNSLVVVELPYIDGKQIATWKNFTGLDLVSEGEWKVEINTNPNQPDAWSIVAIVGEGKSTTIANLDIDIVGESPLVAIRLTNSRPGPAKLSKVIIHYNATKSS